MPEIIPSRRWHPPQRLSELAGGDPLKAIQAIPQQVVTGEDIQARDVAETEYAVKGLAARGQITAVDVTGFVVGIAAITPPVVIVQYTVPQAYFFKFTRAGWSYSQPVFNALAANTFLPWQVQVDGVRLPFVGENLITGFRFTPGSFYEPIPLEPLWVGGGSTVRLCIVQFAAFTLELNIAARIIGELVRPQGLKLEKDV